MWKLAVNERSLRQTTLSGALMVFGLFFPAMAHSQEPAPRTRAEATGYEETTRYDEVVTFIDDLQRGSRVVHVESFGETTEGRSMPLVVLADPPIARPGELRESSKPAVFVMANIHGGEVEGKEAALQLYRRIVTGELEALLEDIVILIAPIYNADGNERISPENRARQNGPIGGVGTRVNAMGLDLNRDYMKMESPEARGLIGLFNRWDPHVIVDLHTTNGSYHGYHLTYSPPLNPNADADLIAYEREEMLPSITRNLLERHDVRAYYYGNFAPPPGSEAEPAPGNRVWQTFDHRPRFGNSYGGLRNRISILSEAYSYVDFRGRVEATAAFVEEILRYSALHAGEIVELTRRLDEEATERGLGNGSELGVRFGFEAAPDPVDILVAEVQTVTNPRSGAEMTAVIPDRYVAESMIEYGTFRPTRFAPLPAAYVFAPEPGLARALDRLKAHGITVEEAQEEFTLEVDLFTIERVSRARREFQGHRETLLDGQFTSETRTFPSGAILVRTAQPLGALAFYLLEPESDDGLANWNFLEDYLEGNRYPIYKVMDELRVATRILR